MEIQRGKFLTKIIGSDHVLAMSTKKFDDIMGIMNGILPDASGTPEELSEILSLSIDREPIKIDGKEMMLKDLLEFSDLDFSLYSQIVTEASIKLEKKNPLKSFTEIFFLSMMENLCRGEEFGQSILGLPSIRVLNRDLSTGISSKNYDLGKYSPRKDFIEIMYSSKKITIPFLSVDKSRGDFIERVYYVVQRYNSIINGKSFIGDNGKEYSMPRISEDEVSDIVVNKYLQKIASSPNIFDIKSSITLSFFSDIITKTTPWKKIVSGLLMMENSGQMELVDISTLTEKNIFELNKLSPKVFQKIENSLLLIKSLKA